MLASAILFARPTVDLSLSGTANCYIVGAPGNYRFYALAKGAAGLTSKELNPVTAKVLWQNPASADMPEVVSDVRFDGDFVSFRSPAGKKGRCSSGNALIAVLDSVGTVIWSWHIWAPETPLCTHTYANGAGEMMDRDLGALNALAGSPLSKGLFYQWGRKDPFPVDGSVPFPDPVTVSATSGTDSFCVSHPMHFITGTPETCFDWHLPPHDTTFWSPVGGGKGLYDPCPPGWRVPDGSDHGLSSTGRGPTPFVRRGFWVAALGWGMPSYGHSSHPCKWWNGRGLVLPAKISGGEAWYPAAGIVDPVTGKREEVGLCGSEWTRGSEPAGHEPASTSYCFVFGASGRVDPAAFGNRASGRNVRCVKEKGAGK